MGRWGPILAGLPPAGFLLFCLCCSSLVFGLLGAVSGPVCCSMLVFFAPVQPRTPGQRMPVRHLIVTIFDPCGCLSCAEGSGGQHGRMVASSATRCGPSTLMLWCTFECSGARDDKRLSGAQLLGPAPPPYSWPWWSSLADRDHWGKPWGRHLSCRTVAEDIQCQHPVVVDRSAPPGL